MKKGGVRDGAVEDVRQKEKLKPLLQNQNEGDVTSAPNSKGLLHHSSSDSGLFTYILPSHSNILFTNLQRLKEEEVLLDCTFIHQRNSFLAHKLVLAATSRNPMAFLRMGLEEVAGSLTPVGLRAVLEFAYCGNVAVDFSNKGVTEEILQACQCLQMERLRDICMSKVTNSAATEKDKSLAVIKDMWSQGIGCDVAIQADSGERYSGKVHLNK